MIFIDFGAKSIFHDIPFFTSFTEALEKVESNAILIATPPEYHYDQVILAFKRGKHVICEKPLTLVIIVRLLSKASSQERKGSDLRMF